VIRFIRKGKKKKIDVFIIDSRRLLSYDRG